MPYVGGSDAASTGWGVVVLGLGHRERCLAGTRGQGVTVAVLDTGVNAALPELSGAVLKGEDSAEGKTDGRKDLDEQEAAMALAWRL